MVDKVNPEVEELRADGPSWYRLMEGAVSRCIGDVGAVEALIRDFRKACRLAWRRIGTKLGF